MDWLDLLAVQGTLKSLLQNHSSKASTLQCSAFFMIQLSHPNMTTGKTIALTRWTFIGKVMSLLFNMLSRLLRTSLVAQMVKRLSIMQETWVQSLGWEDLLEKAMAPHSSILAWKIPWTEEPGRLQSLGLQRVGHSWATSPFTRLLITFLPRSKHLLNVLLSSKHFTLRPSVTTILDKMFQKVNWFSANQLSSTRWSLIL